jgi:hypothetical protein
MPVRFYLKDIRNNRTALLRSLTLICWLLIAGQSYSQFAIKGKVTTADKQALEYVQVALLKDSAIVKTTYTDSVGAYVFLDQEKAKYTLAYAYVGYEEKKITVCLNNDTALYTNLNTAYRQLKEVVVTNKKPLVEKKIDRLVFNVENSIVASGSNTFDLLGKTPLVQTTESGISVIGKSNCGVLLNDKFFHLSGSDLVDFLRSIPSDDIERIEVITTPPAKYDANGSALINVVTKRKKIPGMNGSINASYTQAFYPTLQTGGVFNYRANKINVYGNLSGNKGATHPIEKTSIYYPNSNFNQLENTKRNNKAMNGSLGTDYEINKNNTIGLLYNYSISSLNAIGNTLGSYLAGKTSIDSTITTHTTYARSFDLHSGNINHVFKIDSSGKKITTDADYMYYSNNRARNFLANTIQYPPSLIHLDSNNNHASQLINIATIKADVELPFEVAKLDAGFKLTRIHNASKNTIIKYESQTLQLGTMQKNDFEYEEQTQAAYINLSKSYKKIEAQIGCRLENTTMKGYSLSMNIKELKVDRKFLQLFPSFYFLYTISNNHSLSFSYGRSVERPGYNALNPFRFYQTSYIYMEGNPYLMPAYFTNIDLSYTLNGKYVMGVSYFNMYDSYAEVPMQINAKVLAYVQNNIGSTTQYGSYVVLPLVNKIFIESSLTMVYLNSHYATTLAAYENSVNPVFVCDVQNQVYFDRNRKIAADVFIHSFPFGSIYGINEMGRQYVVNAGIRITLLGGKSNLTIGVNDIFHQSAPTGLTTMGATIIKVQNTYDTRNARVSFSYKFGYKGLKGKRQREMGNQEEKNRAN